MSGPVSDNGNECIRKSTEISSRDPNCYSLRVLINRHDLITGVSSISKFGSNPDVDSGVLESVWSNGGRYIYLTSASVLSVFSDNANDTAAGTGARTVTIQGLDPDYNEIEETVSMNGTTPVATTLSFLRVNRAFVATAGSTLTNEGDIFGDVAADTLFKIDSELGQTLQSIYTVPAGKLAHLHFITAGINQAAGGTGIKSALVYLSFRELGGAFRTRWECLVNTGGTSSASRTWEQPVHFPEKTDLEMRVLANQNNCKVTGEFDLALVEV